MKILPVRFFHITACALMLVLSLGASASSLVREKTFDIFLFDIDGDGIEDIVLVPQKQWALISKIVLNVNRQGVQWLQGLEGGSFSDLAPWGLPLPSNMSEPLNSIVADLTGNGLKDIFIQSNSPLTTSLFLTQNSRGQLTLKQQLFNIEGIALHYGAANLSVRSINGQMVLILNDQLRLVEDASGYFQSAENLNAPSLPKLNIDPVEVGSNNYNVSVSESGRADIDIPIALPPGINGHTPALSLRYNSRDGGNGVMGVGWHIAGLSVISRCSKTLAIDGIANNHVSYDISDRLCMSGQRLVPRSGATLSDSQYWQPGNEFSLENDHTTKITLKAVGSNSVYFEVLTKSGQKMIFGGTEGSRIRAEGLSSVVLWAVSSSEDITVPAGDMIHYSYRQDPVRGVYYPDRVEYDGVEVNFGYAEGREDAVRRYNGYFSQLENRFLNSISIKQQTRVGMMPFRQYQLEYDYAPNTQLLRLSRVFECQANRCADPYRIEWSENPGYQDAPLMLEGSLIEGARSTFISSLSLRWPQRIGKLVNHYHAVSPETSKLIVQDIVSGGSAEEVSLNGLYHSLVSADLNNNGYPELVGRAGGFSGGWKVINLLPSSGASSLAVSYQEVYRVDSSARQDARSYSGVGGDAANPIFIDIDRDGRLDMLLPSASGWRVLRNITSAKSNDIRFEDKGLVEGISDIYLYAVPVNLTGGEKAEVLWRGDSEWKGIIFHADFSSTIFDPRISLSAKNSLLVDINGDGLLDIVDMSTGVIQYQINNGLGFGKVFRSEHDISAYTVKLPKGIPRTQESRHYVQVMDYNRDGMQDLLVRKPSSNKWWVMLSNGSGFNEPVPTSIPVVNPDEGKRRDITTRIMDVDGDGNPEILQYAVNVRQEIGMITYGETEVYLGSDWVPYHFFDLRPEMMSKRWERADFFARCREKPGFNVGGTYESQRRDSIMGMVYTVTLRQKTYSCSAEIDRDYGYKWKVHQPVQTVTGGINELLGNKLQQGDLRGAAFRPHMLIGMTDQLGGYTGIEYAPMSQYRRYANMGFGEDTWFDQVFSEGELETLSDEMIELAYPIPAVVALYRPGNNVGVAQLFAYDTPYYSTKGRGFLGVRARMHLTFDVDQLRRWSPYLNSGSGGDEQDIYAQIGYEIGAEGSLFSWQGRLENFHTVDVMAGLIKSTHDYRSEVTPAGLATYHSRITALDQLGNKGGSGVDGSLVEMLLGTKVLDTRYTWRRHGTLRDGANGVYLQTRFDQAYTPREGVLFKETYGHYDYDFWGNIRHEMVWKRAGGELFSTRINRSYDYDVASWMLGFVRSKLVTKISPDGEDIKRTTYTIFPGTRKPAVVTHRSGPRSSVIRQEQLAYDNSGNLVSRSIRDPESRISRSVSYSNFQFGRYPGLTTNALGHVSTSVFDSVAGRMVSHTDSAGARVTYQYDGFGRPTLTTADTYNGQSSSRSIDYNRLLSGAGHAYSIVESGGGQPEITTFYNKRGMPVRQESVLLDGSLAAVNSQYDNAGRLISRTVPGSEEKSRFAYDKMGRPVYMAQPGASSTLSSYSTNPVTGKTTVLLIERDTRSDAGAGGNPFRVSERVLDARSRLLSIKDPLGNVIHNAYYPDDKVKSVGVEYAGADPSSMLLHEFEYDGMGRRTRLSDPNTGVHLSEYNVFGDVKMAVDPAGRVTQYIYDAAGRMTSRTDAANSSSPSVSQWFYDSVPSVSAAVNAGQSCGEGRLCASMNDAQNEDSFYEEHEYDASGVVVKTHTVIGGRLFTRESEYDGHNRLLATRHPNGVLEKYAYNFRGYLYQQGFCPSEGDCPGNGYIGSLIDSVNAFNSPTQVMNGNGVVTHYQYDPLTNQPLSIVSGNGTQGEVQSLGYAWDGFGNMKSRTNERFLIEHQTSLNVSEHYGYDLLDRIETLNNAVLYAYDPAGNLLQKPGVEGVLEYGGLNGPHQLSQRRVDNQPVQTFAYDANGNMINDGARSITYTPFNKPEQITAPGITKTFSYGPDRQRYRQVSEANDGSRLEVIYLAGGTFKETRLLESPGSVRVRQDMQIAGAVQFRRSFTLTNGVESNITTSTHYVHADALGSVDAVTDQNGNLVSANAYSPFGMRRDADWSSLSMLPTLSLPEMFDRVMDNGFTQHEMLDDTGLIHMGGRLYDPVLGRFMSADPFVQAPQNSQSFNRYSYVWNNPFKYVDPTGYILVPMESWDMRGISIGNAWSFDINNNITNHINNSGLSNIQWLESNNGSSSNTGTVAARPASASPSPPPSPPPPSLSVETGRMISATSGSVGGSGTVSANNSLGDLPPSAYLFACNGCEMVAAPGSFVSEGFNETYWDVFREKWDERSSQFAGAADDAVYWWIDRQIPVVSPVMGGLASLAVEENIGRTLTTLSVVTGVGAARAYFTGSAGGGLANASLAFGVSSDLLSGNAYISQKLGLEAFTRVLVKFGPSDVMGARLHRGINQGISTWSGFFVGRED